MHEPMNYGKALFGSAVKVYIKEGILITVSILKKKASGRLPSFVPSNLTQQREIRV